jgi:hypothetical protein
MQSGLPATIVAEKQRGSKTDNPGGWSFVLIKIAVVARPFFVRDNRAKREYSLPCQEK